MLSLLKKREPSDRSRLIAAFEARDRTQRVLNERRETLARLQAVDDHANELARLAVDAERADTEARRRWIHDGCLAHAREHHAATEAAAEAKRAAELAAADATAARKQMPAAESAVRSAESDLKTCTEEIDNQIGLIQLEQFKETLEEFRQVTDRRHQLHIAIRGFLEGSLSGDAARQVKQVLDECHVQSIPDYASTAQGTHVSSPPAEVLDRAREWRKEAAELRADPNAQ
jgi:hypothetical protein